ncbi:MAG TPA: cyclic pyranopterin monophosphate synthase MoaC, partial [Amaricoccus sp.]|nr:cyclic pyranopterin monophosphate synthase MoaC [Amaricoccus sp.]
FQLDPRGHFDRSGRKIQYRLDAGRIRMTRGAVRAATTGGNRKGDPIQTARLAGIMAAKRTAELVPLCHPLPLSKVSVDLRPDPGRSAVEIEATTATTGPTGVEMEALTAVSVAALTVYDMLKAVDRGMVIGEIRLALKEGGKSGRYEAP